MGRTFDVKAEGLEHLPAEGPFVLTPNHVSYLDPMAIAAVLPQEQLMRTYWAGFTGVMFRNAIMRWISRMTRVVPVDPRRGPLVSLALGVLLLRRGNSLVWFPEAGRSETGELRPFEFPPLEPQRKYPRTPTGEHFGFAVASPENHPPIISSALGRLAHKRVCRYLVGDSIYSR